MHRIAVLARESAPASLRADRRGGRATWHIGRRHVEDTEGDPVVVDWRAPVAVPFYRATRRERPGSRPAAPDHGRPRPVDRRGRRPVRSAPTDDPTAHPAPRRRRAARRARAGPDRRDARHRRHHPGRAGRDHPGAARPAADRPGRTGHRQDGGRTAPGRLPALQPSATAGPRGRARARPEPGLPPLHRPGPPLARRGGGRADDDRPTSRPRRRCAADGADGGPTAQGRSPDGARSSPRPGPTASPPR